MAYVDNYDITRVYWERYLDIYLEVYAKVFDSMKGLYEDEVARAAGVNTTMIAFTKAAGMDMAGVVSWDEALAGETPDFVSFAAPKKPVSPSGGSFVKSAPSSGYQKPTGGAPTDKKPYDGPKELKGQISEKQLGFIHGFLNSKNDKVRSIAEEFMAEENVASPEDLSKQTASAIIDACFKETNKGGKRY